MAERRSRVLRPNRRLGLGRGANGQRLPPAPEVSMEPRPVAAAPVEQSVVDAAIYRDGRRVDSPSTLAETYERLREQPGAMAWIGLYRPAEAQLLAARRGVRPARAGRRGRHRRPPAARSSSATATPCSSCCAPPATSTRPRRSSSASCTSSSARTSSSPSGTAEAPDLAAVRRRHGERPRAAAPRPRGGALRDPRRGRRRLRARWSPACRTTSTRSRPRSSAATRRSPGASTSCPARSSSSSGPPGRCCGMLDGARPPGSRSTASTRSCSATCATSPTTPPGRRAGRRLPPAARATSSPSTPRWSPSAQNEEMKHAHRGQLRAERGGQEDLRLGGHPVRARR